MTGRSEKAVPRAAHANSPLWRFEHRTHKVIARHRFVARMGLAIGLWFALTLAGLAIGMTGYYLLDPAKGVANAFVSAAMILSGMGPFAEPPSTAGKIFAGLYAIFSGLIIVIATGFVLAPVFHRVLHKFHVEESEKDGGA